MPHLPRLARDQFDLAWRLWEYHASRLEPDDFCWEPAPLCWTMRRSPDGSWVPDFAEVEPDPVPAATIAWLTWHLGWWLGTATDHLTGATPRSRGDVAWPGPGEPTLAWLHDLADSWRSGLATSPGDRPVGFPWPPDAAKTTADLVGWVNMELMKNVAEIGQLRILRTAQRTG